jgi:hypothetical protein
MAGSPAMTGVRWGGGAPAIRGRWPMMVAWSGDVAVAQRWWRGAAVAL